MLSSNKMNDTPYSVLVGFMGLALTRLRRLGESLFVIGDLTPTCELRQYSFPTLKSWLALDRKAIEGRQEMENQHI